MTTIKFGTDGWRAIIADDYTVANVARVAQATADWLLQYNDQPSVLIGYDCRFGGKMFAETTARVMAANSIRVKLDPEFASTPMVSLGAYKYNTDAGIILTASHNPPEYHGYKLKGNFGGPSLPASIKEVEDLIQDQEIMLPDQTFADYQKQGWIEHVNLEDLYIEHVKKNFDFESINKSDNLLAFDAMYGTGQNVMRRLLPNSVFVRCDENPSFKGQAPEPIPKNLQPLQDAIRENGNVDLGFGTDGDADRIGMFDDEGQFVDPHHIILLLIHYLHKYKGLNGKVVVSFAVSNKVKRLCEAYGLEYEITKIGFKHICKVMLEEDVLLGGEESGGIAVKGHIPERDGIWDALEILEFMASTGKSINELIQEVYEITGPLAYQRNDLHIPEEDKQRVIKNCRNDTYKNFGDFTVTDVETIDGFKFYLGEDTTLMIRPSGTEPVLRVYAEAPDQAAVDKLQQAAKDTLLSSAMA